MHICRIGLMAVGLSIAAAGPAEAGPDIVEDCATDAGSFPGSATPARGPGPSG